MSQISAKSRTVAGRTGVGLALVSAMTVGTAASAAAAPATPQPAAPVAHPRPAAPVVPAATVAAPAAASTSGTYTVQRGDTVWGIAAKTGTSVSAILSANGLGSNAVIHPGQTLRLSGSSSAASQRSGSTSSAIGGTYTVQRGDTVSGIASKTGTSVASIIAANNLGSAAVIYPGQTLRLSGSSSAASSSSSTAGRVGSTFLGRTYSNSVVGAANANARALDSRSVPSRAQMQSLVRQVAGQMGVDPSLALAHAHAESGFDQRAVSPANAVGVMQVIPSSGEWASQLVGRKLDLLDPHDNVVAGVAIIRQLHRMESDPNKAIAGYYQGLGSVRQNGMYSDTRNYVNKIQGLRAQYR